MEKQQDLQTLVGHWINTSYLTDSYIIFTLKMESLYTIVGLEVIVKSGLEK